MPELKRDWLVRVYDYACEEIDKIIIEDRTEYDANREAEDVMDKRSEHEDIGDWTMEEK